MKQPRVRILLALALGSSASAQPQPHQSPPSAAPVQPEKICQSVVNAEVGANPYKLCLTKDEWAARKLAEAKDANRIVCHYEEDPGSRFRSSKVCMPASQWEDQRMQERQSVEQIQRQPCVAGGGC